jgi:HEPN domain-containing protein
MPKRPLSPTILAELPQRLLDAAEAFYYAAILCSLAFDAENIDRGAYQHLRSAAQAAITGPNRINDFGAPPVVNFGFAIELYIKLLRFLADGRTMSGHNLQTLFLELEKVAPDVAATAIRNHFYWSGDRDEFMADIAGGATVFERWRYAHEESFLCTSVDSLLTLVNAFRLTVAEIHPTLRSAFRAP